MNNNNNEAKNEKLREYLKTHNLDNLPITDLDKTLPRDLHLFAFVLTSASVAS